MCLMRHSGLHILVDHEMFDGILVTAFTDDSTLWRGEFCGSHKPFSWGPRESNTYSMQRSNVDLPPGIDSLFCPTETNKEDLRNCPGPTLGEGQSG